MPLSFLDGLSSGLLSRLRLASAGFCLTGLSFVGLVQIFPFPFLKGLLECLALLGLPTAGPILLSAVASGAEKQLFSRKNSTKH
jgi:hypothetical protein